MKKTLIGLLLVMALAVTASGQDYWHIKAAPLAVLAMPQDDNGAGVGAGAVMLFGYPDDGLNIGFEARKWWRSYDIYDADMASVRRIAQSVKAGNLMAQLFLRIKRKMMIMGCHLPRYFATNLWNFRQV